MPFTASIGCTLCRGVAWSRTGAVAAVGWCDPKHCGWYPGTNSNNGLTPLSVFPTLIIIRLRHRGVVVAESRSKGLCECFLDCLKCLQHPQKNKLQVKRHAHVVIPANATTRLDLS
eukprot:2937002-Rhodomonas_salina.3